MEDAIQALMIAFSTIVFVMALTLAMYLINSVSDISQYLTYYSDTTKFYDSVKLKTGITTDSVSTRTVSAETIIPTLYRYKKETFCVKIFDENDNLVQIFDLDLEGDVWRAASALDLDDKLKDEDEYDNQELNRLKVYRQVYNDPNKTGYYMFGVPWIGGTEDIKSRVDLFVAGAKGLIEDVEVDYTNNAFAESLKNVGSSNWESWHYSEKFINYSYSGATAPIEGEDDVLVEGQKPKDKIIIEYRRLK